MIFVYIYYVYDFILICCSHFVQQEIVYFSICNAMNVMFVNSYFEMNVYLSIYLQDPRTKGQLCQSIGKLDNIIGHLAFIVNLKFVINLELQALLRSNLH